MIIDLNKPEENKIMFKELASGSFFWHQSCLFMKVTNLKLRSFKSRIACGLAVNLTVNEVQEFALGFFVVNEEKDKLKIIYA